jgi:propanol-preferring alcohol dehydrogenase
VPLRTHVRPYALEQANAAVADLRAGRIEGVAVLVP